MSNLKQQLKDAGLVASFEQPFVLGPGARRMRRDDQVIWANLLNSKWLRVPQTADRLIMGCTERSPRECMSDYCGEYGASPDTVNAFLEYLLSIGVLGVNLNAKDDLEGVDIVNPQGEARSDKVEIREVFKFRSAMICLDPDDGHRPEGLSLKKWRAIFETLSQAQMQGISFFGPGGDSMGQMQFEEIVRTARACFTNVGLHTIGECIGPEGAAFLSSTVDRVVLDADDLTALEGKVEIEERLRRRIEPLTQAEIQLTVRCTYHVPKVSNLSLVFDACQELQVPFYLTACSPTGSVVRSGRFLHQDPEAVLEVWTSLVDRHRLDGKAPFSWDGEFMSRIKLSCGAGRGFFAISSNGGVYPCPDLMVEEFKLGSILSSSVPMLESKAQAVLGNANVDAQEGCRDCSVAYFCGGGCLARIYHAQGRSDGKDLFCGFIRDGLGLVPWHFDMSAPVKENLDRLYNQGIWPPEKRG